MDNNKSKNKKIIIIVCVAIVICLGVFICIKNISNKKESTNINRQDMEISEKNSVINNVENNIVEKIENNVPNKNVNYDKNGSFLMPVENIITTDTRGIVVSGKIERGTIKLNDKIEILGLNDEVKTTSIIGIEKNEENVETADAGENVQLILKDIKKSEIEIGQVLAQPNTMKTTTKISVELYMMKTEEGGRHTAIKEGYRPQFCFWTVEEIIGVVDLPVNVEEVKPGETVKIEVELIYPAAIEVGTEFNIKEGERITGYGKVTKIY